MISTVSGEVVPVQVAASFQARGIPIDAAVDVVIFIEAHTTVVAIMRVVV